MPFIHQPLIADGVLAEGRVVLAEAILQAITNSNVLTMTVGAAGGAGYVVGETFDVNTGTAVALNGASFVATGRVTSVSVGVVTGVELLSAGAYTVNPTLTGSATTNSSGAGNNALTVNLTMQTARWTEDTSTFTTLLANHEWLATSVKTTNKPTIGVRSLLSGADDGIRLQCATGFDGGATWDAQPGSPPTNEFVMTCPNQNPDMYLSVTERRVNVLVTDGTFKQYGQLGLFIPFVDVDTNYPFPGIVAGNTRVMRQFNINYEQSSFSGGRAGIVHPMDLQVGEAGPYQYRNNLSTEWFGLSHDNNFGSDLAEAQIWPDQGAESRYQMQFPPVPAGSAASAADMDPFNSNQESGPFDEEVWFASDDQTDETGSQGPQPLGTGSQLHFTTEAQIIQNRPNDPQPIGIIDGFENVHLQGLTAFDEIVAPGGRRFLVFNDTNATQLWRGVAMEIV